MKKKSMRFRNMILFATVIFLISCEKDIPEPVADFRILDVSTIHEVNPNEIVTGETIVFDNTGTGQYLTVWTGNARSVYSENPKDIEYTERESSYTMPNGEEITYTSILLDAPEDAGYPIPTKTGQRQFTYNSAGTSGDTTYTVTWIATNVDVHGNSTSAMKQITVRVRDSIE
jgi:hypothetical protein